MSGRLNLTLLGHKDHGKSTLIGRLLFDTRSVMEDRVREVQESSRRLGKTFEYCFLLDSFSEEREGGMTIDVIHAQVKGERHVYDCIDVPGHRELIRNMLTGASGADAGILIASAVEGIEEQTGQHLRLARWLGLDQLVVAVNKMDAVGYEEKVFDAMCGALRTLLGGPGSAGISFIPVSAMAGDNVVARSAAMPWYTGPTLYQAMEALAPVAQPLGRPFRLPVQSLYPGPEGRALVVGRIESGVVRVGDRLVFAPGSFVATVLAIRGATAAVASAEAGENVGLDLDPPPDGLRRGAVAGPLAAPPALLHEFSAPAILLEDLPRGTLSIECGTAATVGTIEPAAGQRALGVGEVSEVAIRLREPLVAERSRTAIGRLAIKHQGRIVGVARVA